ncbi:hypothetical protein EMIHUDRAFT_458342 [Emiliania huxleyi CCMP1516]|uniref:Glycosyltransferase 61 catalytic domain-containing protein n=2 Tax=Emiliania huxleyi TaxID=2903 RepID=A0A0D3JDF2_EMIH1|nr:hypothetical protein EMIHUDRAFT_458342 [Emiliania huxleyi CCMP1516]EOD21537.1 hypothetical protein EMIHUDRAFT_458342 [Emiliania huxleyi CCMP1516]|eukprot:XP_005773966.1 hypothetical protein EMIHUDRAFT_458342 [Emiliania huxleyi CCMP1516]
MRNAWRITRWDPGAGTPTYLLASAFTVTPSLCAQATRVDCVIDSSNSIRGTTNFRHFAHAAESLLACWSFFRRYPAARPRLVLKDLRSIDGVIWAESLVRLMGCEVLGGIRAWQYYLPLATLNAAGCAVRGALRQRSGNGYKGREMKWLMSESDASELQQRLHRNHTAGGVLRVGIANRRGSRNLSNVDAVAAALSSALRSVQASSRGGGDGLQHFMRVDVNVVADLGGWTFLEQATWVSAQMLVVMPHGAGSVNYLFARPCTAILEVYPFGYYLPGEYLNLARAVGALGYTAYPGDTPYNDTDRHSSPAARYQARSVSLAPDPARVAEWAVEAVAASAQCRRHQSQGARAPPREAFA